MSEKIYITLGSDYIHNWGFWEAARELIQNAIDCEKSDINFSDYGESMHVNTFDGQIPKEMLMLGSTSKRDDDEKIGINGEGMCLAFLVLCRLGYRVSIKNGLDTWYTSLEIHPQLNTECLCLEIKENVNEDANFVSISIFDLTDEDYKVVNERYILMDNFDVEFEYKGNHAFRWDDHCYEDDRASLIENDDKHIPKKLFVSGLFVCDLPEGYAFSYNFTPDRIKLDRDRKTVDNFDLQWQIADLLESAEQYELMLAMSEEQVPDLANFYTPRTYQRYGEEHKEPASESLKRLSLSKFKKDHGDNAIAIKANDSQEKRQIIIKRASSIGLNAVEVPYVLYSMLPDDVKSLPESIAVNQVSVQDMISDFISENKKHMRSKAYKNAVELLENIKMKG